MGKKQKKRPEEGKNSSPPPRETAPVTLSRETAPVALPTPSQGGANLVPPTTRPDEGSSMPSSSSAPGQGGSTSVPPASHPVGGTARPPTPPTQLPGLRAGSSKVPPATSHSQGSNPVPATTSQQKGSLNVHSVPPATAKAVSVEDLARCLDRTKLKKPNVCGAERKRRRKAKAAAAATSQNKVPAGTNRPEPNKDLSAQGSKHGAQSAKRPRKEGSTPEGQGRAHKRPRMTCQPGTVGSYAQAAGDWSLRVAITRENEPEADFSEVQLSEFSDAVAEAVLQTPSGSSTALPQFISTRSWRQHLLITAANEYSRDWLLRELVNIQPWEGVRLIATDPTALRLNRATIWVPGRRHRPDQEVLRILELQNPGLVCTNWRIRMRREEERGLLLVVGIDNASVNLIRRSGLCLFYGTTRASVQIKGKTEAAAPTAAASEASEVAPSHPPAGSEGAALDAGSPCIAEEGAPESAVAVVAASSGAPVSEIEMEESLLLVEDSEEEDDTLTGDIFNHDAEGAV